MSTRLQNVPLNDNDIEDQTNKLPNNKGKSQAQSVCCEISRLLSEKGSNTRGSCMFRKRRKRSEKFAIIGYGTQPVEEDAGCNWSDVESDSIFTSSDDEIEAYDHPGLSNLLEQDIHLTSAEKVIHNQLKNLVKDTKQMKGKGAKMFAKRQERMEKFVVDGSVENSSNCDDVIEKKNTPPSANYENSTKQKSSICFSTNEKADFEVVSFPDDDEKNSINTANSGEDSFKTENFLNRSRTSIDDEAKLMKNKDSSKLNDVTELREKPVFSNENKKFNLNFLNNKPKLEHNLETKVCSNKIVNETTVDISQKSRFRSVKPPISGVKENSSDLKESDPIILNLHSKTIPQFTPVLKNQNKTWSSVKFDPASKSASKCLDSQIEFDKQEKTLSKVSNDTTKTSFESILRLPPVRGFDKQLITQQKARSPSVSVQLLGGPLLHREIKFQDNSCETDKKTEANLKQKSVRGDFTPKSSSPQLVSEDNFSSLTLSEETQPQNAARSNQIHPSCLNSIENQRSTPDEQGLIKPKVAACMRLMDPSKGKYEPKTTTVYKQTSSAGSRLNEVDKQVLKHDCQYSRTIQFNKPVTLNQSLPQVSYLKQQNSATTGHHEKEPQPLGAIAGDIKGAKMFEKQQKRMDIYSKESEGSVENVQQRSFVFDQPKKPEDLTRKKMSHVVGEFKKVSGDLDSPKRPSVTRTSKARDPYHYHHHYVPALGPTADDFVFPNDVFKRTSNSTQSTTSSVTSHDQWWHASASTHSILDDEANKEKEKTNSNYLNVDEAPKPGHDNISGVNSSLSYRCDGALYNRLPSPPTYDSFMLHQEQEEIFKSDCIENFIEGSLQTECDHQSIKSFGAFNQFNYNSFDSKQTNGKEKSQSSSIKFCKESKEL